MEKGCMGCLQHLLRPLGAVLGGLLGAVFSGILVLFGYFAFGMRDGAAGPMVSSQDLVELGNRNISFSSTSISSFCLGLQVFAIGSLALAVLIVANRRGAGKPHWRSNLLQLLVIAFSIFGVMVGLVLFVPINVALGVMIGAIAGAAIAVSIGGQSVILLLVSMMASAGLAVTAESWLAYFGSVIVGAAAGGIIGIVRPVETLLYGARVHLENR